VEIIPRSIPQATHRGKVPVNFDFCGDGLDADDWVCSGSLIAPGVLAAYVSLP
jgi:hypothetical protein